MSFNMRSLAGLFMLESAAAHFPGQIKGKGYIPTNMSVPMLNASLLPLSVVPDAIDWSAQGATTEIRDQGSCGCCWAFSIAETIESAAKMAGYNLEKLSAGQLCRCDKSDGGCNGGSPVSALDYVHANGLDSYADDSYGDQVNDQNTEACKWSGNKVATIQGYAQVPQDEESLAQALATYGPLAVCINARPWPNQVGGPGWSWTGIAPWADQCTAETSDHCVQLVGYDKTGSAPYWKLRNQWGSTWGEDGYVRLPYGSNSCGITQGAFIVQGAQLVSSAKEVIV